ncbi:MAG: hydantoinase/oxoprolinase family protein [Deltaproteobacteria bacterium]
MFRLGIDIGGTFTDLTLFDEEKGEIVFEYKISSTSRSPIDAVIQGIEFIKSKMAAVVISDIVHGTTIGLNTILEGKGDSPVLVTTKGFRDIYELGRQWRGSEVYNLFIDAPKTFVPSHQIIEVKERVNYLGEVITPLSEEEIRHVLQVVSSLKPTSIAVSLIFSFANPDHEQILKKAFQTLNPEPYISLSSEVDPHFREYERTCSTVINSYIGPRVSNYLKILEARVNDILENPRVFIMQSSGGVATPQMLYSRPLDSILSGPSAGVIGARYVGNCVGFRNLISIDIGGTSCDMSVIPDSLLFNQTFKTGDHVVRADAIDICTIGSGGGSIASVRPGGVIKVGPESAGSLPGPACYGAGGTEPTLTDALVVLGHINPKHLIGGEMEIFPELSKKVIEEKICSIMGIGVVEAAKGIVKILSSQVAGSMRSITVERGFDPREFVLVAFGGAGPTIACSLATELGVPKILVPPSPGNFCAFGMLVTDLMREKSITRISLLEDITLEDIDSTFADLERSAVGEFVNQGINTMAVQVFRFLDMRYGGQSYEISIPVSRKTDPGFKETVLNDFHLAHERTYGHKATGEPVELVNFRVRCVVKISKPALKEFTEKGSVPSEIEQRKVYFWEDRGMAVPVFERSRLEPGQKITGPAIIEEITSTTVVYPGYRATIDRFKNILLELLEI